MNNETLMIMYLNILYATNVIEKKRNVPINQLKQVKKNKPKKGKMISKKKLQRRK